MRVTRCVALLLAVGLYLGAVGPQGLGGEASRPGVVVPKAPQTIVLRAGASRLESLAGTELQRYVYLRTGRLLPIRVGAAAGDRVCVTRQDGGFSCDVGKELAPQQFTLQCGGAGDDRVWWIVGGDDGGVLYGVYRMAEKLGVAFGLEGDAVPDAPWRGDWPEPNEIGKPRFALRGLQPFHDFSVGPDWWNLRDYQSLLAQMAKLRMNFVGFHTYPSWNPAAGPEANVWIGLPGDVEADGDVRFGYEAGVVTTRRGWAVSPFPTSQYAAGASLLFEADDYGPDFMLDCLDWPRDREAAAAMFNRYGDLQRRTFREARRLGIRTCVGTELPLGIPRSLDTRLRAIGLNPEDPAVIERIYEGTFLRLMRKSPVDYYWLWTPEIWLGEEPGCRGWEITTRANTERDLRLAESAARTVGAPFRFATCGWRLGTRDDALWLDRRTPRTWAASSINTGLGRDPVEKGYGAMPDRPKWAIGWAEDDDAAGAHCCTCWDIQFWVQRLLAHSAEARAYGCEGMLAIHWRTAAIAPNLAALARAGWDFVDARNPGRSAPSGDAEAAAVGAFWADWGRGQFGQDVGAEVGGVLRRLDGSHPAFNALVAGGVQTTDTRIAEFFAPLGDLERLRPRVQGAGNLDRFDYWLNFVRASQLRLRAWILAARLSAKLKTAEAIPDAAARMRFARGEVLPLRVELARGYEALIGAFVDCARSSGELGTIASIESGSRRRLIENHDAAIERMLGEPLPALARIGLEYRGKPRVLVTAAPTQTGVGEPQEIRAFVLSGAACTGVRLYWRRLGEGEFTNTAAVLRARRAYRVEVPAPAPGTVEYYLEASLDDGQKAVWPVTAPTLNHTVAIW